MMQGTYLTHARVVLEDRVLEDSAVLIEDGRIAAIEPAGARPAREIELRGQTLMPGLIDLHSDAIEKRGRASFARVVPAGFRRGPGRPSQRGRRHHHAVSRAVLRQ